MERRKRSTPEEEEASVRSLIERLETAGRALPPLRRQWTADDSIAHCYT